MKVKEVAKDAWIMASGILLGCVFLYKVDGVDGCYCRDCAKIIEEEIKARGDKSK